MPTSLDPGDDAPGHVRAKLADTVVPDDALPVEEKGLGEAGELVGTGDLSRAIKGEHVISLTIHK